MNDISNAEGKEEGMGLIRVMGCKWAKITLHLINEVPFCGVYVVKWAIMSKGWLSFPVCPYLEPLHHLNMTPESCFKLCKSSASSWMSRLAVSEKQVFSSGTDSEVFNIENVSLSLMGCCYDLLTANVIRTGEFALRVAMQSISSILVVFCVVGDLHWPITMDAPVLRVGSRSFAFAMPGFLYGLQFAENCYQDQLEILAMLFMKFAYFEDHSKRAIGNVRFP
ncbi:hypothetical protein NE237_017227 [Protea cynaroides]|uniref:Uncharacterized protein n=1 Tax=Protea cynaroides TaxID=273540 RepID=A0A9Q0K7M7_9MAGN|nr:hypothetical protein NE237_017227 [Protea cynaroides]